MSETADRKLTSGNVFGTMLVFSLPFLCSYFLQTFYGMADLFIIGQFEPAQSITAVSVGSQVMHMLTVIIVGLAMGGTVTIGQAAGAGDNEGILRYMGNTLTLFACFAALLTVVLLTLRSTVVSVMSTPGEAVPGALSYLTICFAGIPFITAYNVISAVYRGLGDSKSPMYFIITACILNIVLDYLFIGYCGMGPSGAAAATVIAQALSVAIALMSIVRKKLFAGMHAAYLRPVRQVLMRQLSTGIPIACQDGLIQIGFILITIIANRRGLIDSAAVGIVEKFMSFMFLVPSAMLSTVSAIGAQCVGAGKPERAVLTLRYACIIALIYGFTMTLIMQFASEAVVGLFTYEVPVIVAGGRYLRGYIADAAFGGVHFSFSGYFCAIEKSWISFFHNVIALCLVRVPGVWLMSAMFPDTMLPMGLATACGSFLSCIICITAFIIIRRKEKAA